MDLKLINKLLGRHGKKSTILGVCSGNMGRYREFDACLNTTIMPKGSAVQWAVGTDASYNLNRMCRAMKDIGAEYLWILGDDHVWQPDLLLNLLDRDVDIVVPLCLRRSNPFWHVVHFDNRRQYRRVPYDTFFGKSGMQNITGLCIGNSGMLINRRVIEKMKDPWFQCGQTNTQVMGSDLYFCEKAADAGFDIWLDLDQTLGHIVHMAVWPVQDNDGVWASELAPANHSFDSTSNRVKIVEDFIPEEGDARWVNEDMKNGAADAWA